MKAFMLAGVSSGIGKTTISMALMSAFDNVSPFKVGPDYIDPGFHEFITGNPSYNLDMFMMGEEGVRYSFYKHHKNISIIEGVMGLYDGMDNSLDNYSSAHLARFLGVPVILVVDSIGKSTSIAAQILGYKMLDSRRSEEHTSELQSRQYLVCRLLLEKKKHTQFDSQIVL